MVILLLHTKCIKNINYVKNILWLRLKIWLNKILERPVNIINILRGWKY